MNPGRAPRRDRGFTLLEIIVVVLVFSVMAAMAYGGLNSVLKTRRAIEDSMQRTAAFQRAFQRLRGDFQNLRDRPARDTYGDAQPSLSMNRDNEVELIHGGWRSPVQTGRSSLERVRYRLKDHDLLRATWRVLDLPQEAEPTESVLLHDVQEMRWRFLDSGRRWQTEWPQDNLQGGAQASRAAAPPPLAVELTLVSKDWGEIRLLFRTPQADLASGSSDTAGGALSGNTKLLTQGGLLPLQALSLGNGTPTTPGTPGTDTPEDGKDGDAGGTDTPGDTPAPEEPPPDSGTEEAP